VLWGSSFVFIKLSVTNISPFAYTFTRTLLASLALLPFVIHKSARGVLDVTSLRHGLVVGFAYATGLVLQGAGTAYIDPSMSAFITGLSTIHVHFYAAALKKTYSRLDLASLIAAMTGLYVLTSPTGGFTTGVVLVFTSTFMWALQIILISRYSYSSITEFLFGTFLAGLVYAPHAVFLGVEMTMSDWVYIAYLALACSIGATLFQVLGQRHVSESTAAIIFLLEPVFATFFSVLSGLEELTLQKSVGGGLILFSLYLSTRAEFRKHK